MLAVPVQAMRAGGAAALNEQEIAMVTRGLADLDYAEAPTFFEALCRFLAGRPAVYDSFNCQHAAAVLRAFTKVGLPTSASQSAVNDRRAVTDRLTQIARMSGELA